MCQGFLSCLSVRTLNVCRVIERDTELCRCIRNRYARTEPETMRLLGPEVALLEDNDSSGTLVQDPVPGEERCSHPGILHIIRRSPIGHKIRTTPADA